MQSNCCGHFSTEVELLTVHHTAAVLRVPVRRCALAERMIGILSRTDEGREIAAKIQIMGSAQVSGADIEDTPSHIRAAFGPDLDAINRTECTTTRCQESCTPGYKQMLRHFGHIGDSDGETGEGCLEVETETADAAM